MVNTFLLIYQLGTCCVYVVFVSENLKSVVNHYTESDTSVKVYMSAILLPLILLNWVRNLKFLAPFSTFANVVTIGSFAIILYYVFRVPPTFEGKVAVGEIKDFPLFFGTVLFALEAIGVVSGLETVCGRMGIPQKSVCVIGFSPPGRGNRTRKLANCVGVRNIFSFFSDWK